MAGRLYARTPAQQRMSAPCVPTCARPTLSFPQTPPSPLVAARVLHKAPMAFGLATYLMACRWSFARSRGTLLAFAAAAPAATMHILPEVLGDSGHMSSVQLAAVVVGSLLPVALSWGHHH